MTGWGKALKKTAKRRTAMPEIRKDPVLNRWIILASERQQRPNDFIAASKKINANVCPFCPGNEKMTPPELCSIPGANGSWKIRIVPNKYPALEGDLPLNPEINGSCERMNGSGRHEVLIETSDHNGTLEKLPPGHLSEIIMAYAARAKEMLKLPFIKYVMIFKNQGKNAGASLAHPHSQLIGIPLPPQRILEEIKGCKAYKEKHGECLFCLLAKEEAALKKRTIAENARFIAIMPYASRFAFETRILPKWHAPKFESINDDEAMDLADIMQKSLSKLSHSIPDLCYNMMIHSSPKEDKSGIYHWHMEIMPKLTQVAGFEWGTGFYINTLSPERAAEILNAGEIFRL